jgi:hypothetical protein
MDHAEAHERIADLALEPEALAALELDRLAAAGPDDRAFATHVRGCPTCRADLAATRAIRDHLDLALDDATEAISVEPMAPPEWLRDAVLEAARREPRHDAAPGARWLAARYPGPSEPAPVGPTDLRPWRRIGPRWVGAIAAVLAVAFLGGLAGSALIEPGPPGPDASLVAAVATLDRVLAAPQHQVVQLQTPTGAAAGTVAWSAQDFAVLTSSLTTPPPGQVYRCWLSWSGRWAAVGTMDFAGSTAYWAEPLGEWANLVDEPGTQFVVTLEAAGPAAQAPTGASVLEATLGS